MPSLKNTLFVATAVMFGVTADYVINPDSVDQSTRDSWCSDELATCPLICAQTEPGTTLTNECDPDTLTYGCICGDGKQPNVSEYTLTLPYHTCVEWGNQCVKACGSDNDCSRSCREDNPCGALSPTTKNETNATETTSSTASATASDGTIYTTLNGDGGNSNSNSGAAALAFGQAYGLAVVAGGLFVGFTLML